MEAYKCKQCGNTDFLCFGKNRVCTDCRLEMPTEKLRAESSVEGAVSMLKEAAKQFRLNHDNGHAAMCEMHARQLQSL